MSKFVLKIGNFVEFPVRLEINDAGTPAVFSFRLTAKRLTAQEWKSHFTEGGEHAEQTVLDFLLDHITAWHGQTLVLDEETGAPAAFTREAFKAMLGVLGVAAAVFAKYQATVLSATGKDGKAKN
jgi:hypothetical protein